MAVQSRRYRCNTCHGEYTTPQADGTLYFHACPPLLNPTFGKTLEEGRIDQREFIPRPDHRDENVFVDRTVDKEGRVIEEHVRAKADGIGRTELGPA